MSSPLRSTSAARLVILGFGEKEEWALLAEAELVDQGLVPLEVAFLQIREPPPAAAHELEQSTTGMMVVPVHLEVLRQVADAVGQERDLDLGRARVLLMPAMLTHQRCGTLPHDCHPALSVLSYSRVIRGRVPCGVGRVKACSHSGVSSRESRHPPSAASITPLTWPAASSTRAISLARCA